MISAEVVIVGKTNVKGQACVGALTLDGATPLRLKPPFKPFWKVREFALGEVWQIEFEEAPEKKNPHHRENVSVFEKRKIGMKSRDEIAAFLDQQKLVPDNDDPREVFRFSDKRNHVRERHSRLFIPDQDCALALNSVGFFRRSVDTPRIERMGEGELKVYFQFGDYLVKYVGFEAAPAVLQAGTIIRLSTATKMLEMENRAYMQVSGWF